MKDDGDKGQPGRKSESKIQTNSKTRDGNYTSWVVTVKRGRCRSCSSMREGGKQDQPDRLCGKEMGDDGREGGKDWLGGGHSELGGISLTATEERATATSRSATDRGYLEVGLMENGLKSFFRPTSSLEDWKMV